MNALSWETKQMVPSYLRSACSRTSRDKTSRWLVGSSSRSRFAGFRSILANTRRLFSPPDSTPTFFSTSSPEKRNAPSSPRSLGRISSGDTVYSSPSTVLRWPSSRPGSCPKYCIATLLPSFTSPAASLTRPAMIFIRVDLPAPFTPTNTTRSPRSISRSRPSKTTLSP